MIYMHYTANPVFKPLSRPLAIVKMPMVETNGEDVYEAREEQPGEKRKSLHRTMRTPDKVLYGVLHGSTGKEKAVKTGLKKSLFYTKGSGRFARRRGSDDRIYRKTVHQPFELFR